MEQEDLNELIDVYFKTNSKLPSPLYRHLHDSYDDLMQHVIPKIVEEYIVHKYINENEGKIIKHVLHTRNIRIKLPCDEYQKEYITPQVARRRNITYSCSVYGDMVLKTTHQDMKTFEVEEFEKKVNDVLITKVPSMVKSSYCVLNLFPEKNEEECDKDPGGYFIVNGNEKIVVSVERQVSNKILFFYKEPSIFVASINSQKSELNNIQQNSVILKNNVLYFSCGFLQTDVSVVALLKSMCIITDLSIYRMLSKNISSERVHNIIMNSIEECKDDNNNLIVSQEDAINYMYEKVSYKKTSYTEVLDTLNDSKSVDYKRKILHNIYEQYILLNAQGNHSKSLFLLYMLNRLLQKFAHNPKVFFDRDSYENKRFDTPGILIGQLFKQAWCKMMKTISIFFIKKNTNDKNPINVINQLKPYYIEQFIKSSLLTGNWGISKNKKGVSRIISRLSFMKAISDMRKIIIPSVDDKTKKITSMRQVHPTQSGYICVVDTPEGEKVGIVKAMSVQTTITPVDSLSSEIIMDFIGKYKDYTSILSIDVDNLSKDYTFLFLNGSWIGVVGSENTYELYNKLLDMKLTQKISKYTSILIEIDSNELIINTDSGRLTRPLLRVDPQLNLKVSKKIVDDGKNKSFDELLLLNPYIVEYVDIYQSLYNLVAEDIKTLKKNQSIYKVGSIMSEYDKKINKYYNSYNSYTHCEFHPSMILGLCASTIPFCNHNQAPRNTYHCIQIKQAMCIHSTTIRNRIDITNVLKDPQIPITKPMMLKHIGLEDLPYGKNVILAIIPFSGYNQEDSMILNKASVERGLFDSASYKGYESIIEKNQKSTMDDIFVKPSKELTMHIKNEVNYDKIKDNGIIEEETLVNTNDVIIGKVSQINFQNSGNKLYKDKSTIYNNMIPCRIDKVYSEINPDGYEMYKVKTRTSLKPMIGDKFTSRHGQKATCGILLRPEDMPHTEDGLIPDIIINANCIPSRMTIGQLYEILISKCGSLNGCFYDSTPFEEIDLEKFKSELKQNGYNPSGTEVMYSGITGERYMSEIFIGPCYYTRLKQIASDKIHARSIGSTQILTRQPPEGRTKNGGLRFGEMERDACIAHGTSIFLKEIMMESSDAYTVHICDDCGFFASKMKKSNSYWCRGCDNMIKISKICIPYCFKLMIQELQSIHIVMKLQTK